MVNSTVNKTVSPRPGAPVRVLIDEATLQARIAELAAAIDRDYAESDRLICVGVLKGSVFFLVDLLKKVNVPLAVDFFQTSSYGSGKTAGEVRIRKDIDLSIRGADVLLIEDIVDTGYTLRTILDLLKLPRRPERQALRPARQGGGARGRSVRSTTGASPSTTCSWSATAWTSTSATATSPTSR